MSWTRRRPRRTSMMSSSKYCRTTERSGGERFHWPFLPRDPSNSANPARAAGANPQRPANVGYRRERKAAARPQKPIGSVAMAIQKEAGKPGSLKYAAAKLGVSLPMVYRLIEAGKLRSYHIGRAHRVSPESIADCIALLERESQ